MRVLVSYSLRIPKGITPWVRLVTIADVFSALTTKRSFGERLSSFDALQLMRDEMGTGLDRRYMREFVRLLHVPPPAPSAEPAPTAKT